MNFLVTARYLVFAIFIVCNAVLASVAVWNASLIPSSTRDARIDTYLTVVGALGLATSFGIIFVELLRRNAFTSRIWFEILFFSTFFALDLGGAAVLSALALNDMCKAPTPSQRSLSPGPCPSSRVLMGFTWLCALILLMYLICVFTLLIVNWNNETVPRIWECTVHNFPPLAPRRSNATVSTFSPRFAQDKMVDVASTAPQRPTTVPSALYTLRSLGLSSQYQFEYFQPPSNRRDSLPTQAPASPTSPGNYLHRNPSNSGNVQAAVALYPQFISSAHVSHLPRAAVPRPTTQTFHPQPVAQSPPPLGDWPRADAPLRIKRKRPPQLQLSQETAVDPPPPRPMGPRTRTVPVNAAARPPAFDLSLSSSAPRDLNRDCFS
ncbi:hypothetical protein R3P38DRAFT_2998607 [Favolaschia claudopus]|uniref:Uncharacterized protein n=1 Tax=Favolaschia claudopus TaxID=2862362 RepID=A0AAW0AR29_9AGAR